MASQQPPAPAEGADYPQDEDERNPYASSSRWRHGESTAFARYEKDKGQPSQPQHHHHFHHHAVAREADSRGGGVSDLADFLNKSRLDPSEMRVDRPLTPRFKPVVAGASEARAATAHAHAAPGLGAEVPAESPAADGREIVCGPLLNYRRMEGNTWVGSVLVVTAGGGRTQPIVPTLELRRVAGGKGGETTKVEGICLYSDARNTFWRFNLAIEMEDVETSWEYELPGLRFASRTKPRVNRFFVPLLDESMRIMFHSCNGFSVGTDEAAWSGPALWNDVLRKHQERPFHVMYEAALIRKWFGVLELTGRAGLAAVTRSTMTAFVFLARCGRGLILPTRRRGRTIRSRRACGRSAMTTT
jgi:hypothetical protein